jgi:beta-aspartyl-dipeptidase (metallo-type)
MVSCVREKGIPLALALSMATKNPAARLKLYPQKGTLAPGSDADILALKKEDLSIVHLILKGRIVLRSGALMIKGKYEP